MKKIIFLCFVFLSCKNKFHFELIKKDTVVWKDLHFLSTKQADDYNYVSFMVKRLSCVDSLDQKVDQNAIRLWFEYPSDSLINKNFSEDILTIRNVGLSNPSIEKITVTRKFDTAGKIEAFVETTPKNLGNPKCGWERVRDTIQLLKIANLPDMQISTHPNETNGGNVVICEIAEHNFYRVFSYTNPKDYQSKSWEAYNFNQFVLFIERQFNFKRIIEY